MAFNRREKRKPGFGDKRLKATICQERSGVGGLLASPPWLSHADQKIGQPLLRSLAADAYTCIMVWILLLDPGRGSAEYKDVAAMIPNGHRPIEAGSASCRAMFLLCPTPPPHRTPGAPGAGGEGQRKKEVFAACFVLDIEVPIQGGASNAASATPRTHTLAWACDRSASVRRNAATACGC